MSLYENPKIGQGYMYYWKNGKAVKNSEMPLYYKLWEDPKYRVIKQENVGMFWISTVWLGINHTITGKRPTLFETMSFCNLPKYHLHINFKKRVVYLTEGSRCSFEQFRYQSLRKAKLGHKNLVKFYKSNPFAHAWEHFRQHLSDMLVIER